MLDECRRICIPLRACVQTGLRNGVAILNTDDMMLWWSKLGEIHNFWFEFKKLYFHFSCNVCFLFLFHFWNVARPNAGPPRLLKLMSRTIFSYQDIYLELAVKSSNIHSKKLVLVPIYKIFIILHQYLIPFTRVKNNPTLAKDVHAQNIVAKITWAVNKQNMILGRASAKTPTNEENF